MVKFLKIGIENVSGLSNIPKFSLFCIKKQNKVAEHSVNGMKTNTLIFVGHIWRDNADMSN